MADLGKRPLWVLLKPASDVPGQWTAHCLNLDIVSQGDSIEHALAMAAEAVLICIHDDLSHDLDPFDRDPAPDDDWEPLHRIMKNPVPLDSVPAEKRNRLSAIAAELAVPIPVAAPNDEPLQLAPPAWQLVAHDTMTERASVP